MSAESAPTLRAPLVGREDVWLRILEAAGRAQDGEGQCVHVVGEAGSGKSRLRLELEETLALRGIRVTGADAASNPEPFGVLLAVLRDRMAEPGFVESLGWTPKEHERVVAHLAGVDEPVSATTTHSERGKVELWSALRKLLLPAAGTPLRVLVFEEFHLADKPCRELVREASSQVADSPVLLVLFEAPGEEPFPLHASYVHLELSPLSREATRELLAAMVDATTIPPATVAALVDFAAGNAFFLTQALQGWITSGVLQWRDDRWRFSGTRATVELPASVQDLLTSDVERLRPAELEVLRVAALLGRTAPRGLVRAAVEGLGRAPEQVEATLVALVRSGLLVGSPEAPALRNAMVGDRVRAGTPPELLVPLHRAIAEAAERVSADPAILAEHWVAAGEPDRAIPHLLTLADRARSAFDLETAADRYGEVAERLGPDDPRGIPVRERWAEVLLLRGEYARADQLHAELARLGPPSPPMLDRQAWCALRLGRYEEATQRCKEAIAALVPDSPEIAAFEALASQAFTAWGRLPLAYEWVHRALARLPVGREVRGSDATDLRVLRALVHRALGAALLAEGRPLDAAGEHETAAELFRAVEDHAEVATSTALLGQALARARRYEMALALLRRAFEHESRLRNLEALGEIHRELGFVHLALGDSGQAMGEAMAGMALASGNDDPRNRAAYHILFGRLALHDGDADSAVSEFESALEIATAVGARAEQIDARLGLAAAVRPADPAASFEHAEAAHQLADEGGLHGQVGAALLACGAARLDEGRVEEAEEFLVDVLHTEHCRSSGVRAEALATLGRLAGAPPPET